jgi:hypothetical protein
MSFWTTTNADEMQDPKRKFRFIVRMSAFGEGANEIWFAKTAAKPSFAIASAEHKYLNHTFYYPGSVTWNDVAITFVDPTNPDVAASFSDLVGIAGYKPPSPGIYSTISKASSVKAMGSVTITQLDADGNDLETWTLWNAWPTEVKYGELEYGGDDLTEVSVTFKYDWAQMTVGTDSASEGSALANSEEAKDYFKL